MLHTTFRLVVGAGLCTVLALTLVRGASALQHMYLWIPTHLLPAATFFVPSITTRQLHTHYQQEKVRVLIVPGHQPESGGTEYKGVYERDIVVDIANALANRLALNPHYEVTVSRGRAAWNPVFQSYFDTNTTKIERFLESQKTRMAEHVADGKLTARSEQVYHNTTPRPAATQLYGINKWASEHDIDITLHLHINDYNRRSKAGEYDGFAVYIPDRQYSNAEASRAVGEAIAHRLSAYHATSTLPLEDAGVVEDQELIAIGAANTADSAALLIEYGYIYEPQFQQASVRPLAIEDYAYQTYLGLQDFFKDPVPDTIGTLALPYDWETVRVAPGASGPGIYALQSALRRLGVYPPAGKNFSDCPVSGKAGPCTITALSAYQAAQGFESTGTLGPKTRAVLTTDLTVR